MQLVRATRVAMLIATHNMELAGRMGYPMAYESPAEVMEEIALLAPIYGGMFHDRIGASWGLQWPCWNRAHAGTPFLHKYFFTRGRGRFMPAAHVPAAELPDADYPFILNTGRIYHHYHTGTMTRKCQALNRESNEAWLEVNPQDADRLGIMGGELVRMASRRGAITVRVQVTEEVAAGSVYTTFHFRETPINRLTIDASDPQAQCPEYKICAVRLERLAP